MKKYIYYTKDGKFEADKRYQIPWNELHSPNEETPALIYTTGTKVWYFKGKTHRLIGPAILRSSGLNSYRINGVYYQFKDWIQNHPNINIYLDAQGMNEAEKALWKLKNL